MHTNEMKIDMFKDNVNSYTCIRFSPFMQILLLVRSVKFTNVTETPIVNDSNIFPSRKKHKLKFVFLLKKV
ncbi:hypothetical protein T01_10143 [Trichinella spiralis]|uniref:Uncharacterized protein n=1 Tax=Trichinella spiralis TaxID=6334 RepID=A0A0V1AUQ6_TRISP|nr:hypothetical protein T01_10143 [Trichinella spiralis]